MEKDLAMNAAWALIWFACGQLPRDAALFHVKAAVKFLEKKQ